MLVLQKRIRINKVNKTTFNSFTKLSKAFLYYDNTSIDRNLNFVMNLGYNNASTYLKSNISFIKLTRSYFHFLLKIHMRRLYKQLLKSIETSKIEVLDQILEKDLKLQLYRDISLFSNKNYKIRIVNTKEPIYLKFINIYELENINVDRDLNGNYKDYIMEYKSKNRISVGKAQQNNIFKIKSKKDIEKEREAFLKSEFNDIALKKLKFEAEMDYNMDYAQKKLGKNIKNEKEINHISNLLDTLKKLENDDSEGAKMVYEKYKDYYMGKSDFIDKKVNSTDLFEFFVFNMKDQYQSLFGSVVDKKTGMIGNIIRWFKKQWILRVMKYSKKVSADKLLYVYDVEVTSKMRIDILDENGDNILDSQYDYSTQMKAVNNSFNNSDNLNYDTGIYNFKTPEVLWNIQNKEYHQRHVIRFEFEKKRRFQNLWKSPYKNMIISDIDLVMKGNKHFKFDDELL